MSTQCQTPRCTRPTRDHTERYCYECYRKVLHQVRQDNPGREFEDHECSAHFAAPSRWEQGSITGDIKKVTRQVIPGPRSSSKLPPLTVNAHTIRQGQWLDQQPVAAKLREAFGMYLFRISFNELVKQGQDNRYAFLMAVVNTPRPSGGAALDRYLSGMYYYWRHIYLKASYNMHWSRIVKLRGQFDAARTSPEPAAGQG